MVVILYLLYVQHSRYNSKAVVANVQSTSLLVTGKQCKNNCFPERTSEEQTLHAHTIRILLVWRIFTAIVLRCNFYFYFFSKNVLWINLQLCANLLFDGRLKVIKSMTIRVLN